MRSAVFIVGVVYSLLIANFYNESHGFTKFYNAYYALWKITPVSFLAIFCALHGAGMKKMDSYRTAAGLAFGALGDYLIGRSNDGIVHGAIAFGLGHFCYLWMLLESRRLTVDWKKAVAILLWGAFTGHFCVFPMLKTQPASVFILTVYSLTLTSCFIISVSHYVFAHNAENMEELLTRMIGFGVFTASDSMLIWNDTRFQIPHAEIVILITYFSAEFLIFYSFVAGSRPGYKKVKN